MRCILCSLGAVGDDRNNTRVTTKTPDSTTHLRQGHLNGFSKGSQQDNTRRRYGAIHGIPSGAFVDGAKKIRRVDLMTGKFVATKFVATAIKVAHALFIATRVVVWLSPLGCQGFFNRCTARFENVMKNNVTRWVRLAIFENVNKGFGRVHKDDGLWFGWSCLYFGVNR